jgi:sulfur relay (sulfurtransferase) complex TusBCD TusD component (DsrE family)
MIIITLELAESLTTAETLAEKKKKIRQFYFKLKGVHNSCGMMAPIERPANETIQQLRCQDPTNWNGRG